MDEMDNMMKKIFEMSFTNEYEKEDNVTNSAREFAIIMRELVSVGFSVDESLKIIKGMSQQFKEDADGR